MEANFVIFASMEEQELPLTQTRDHLIKVATQYSEVLKKAKELLPNIDDKLLAGSAGTVYLKKKGHRALSSDDSENIIRALGSDEDKKALIDFAQAQQSLTDRLKKTKNIGAVMEQAGIHYLKQYRRLSKPELWKAEQIIQVVEALKQMDL
jgi:thymidylate synthase